MSTSPSYEDHYSAIMSPYNKNKLITEASTMSMVFEEWIFALNLRSPVSIERETQNLLRSFHHKGKFRNEREYKLIMRSYLKLEVRAQIKLFTNNQIQNSKCCHPCSILSESKQDYHEPNPTSSPSPPPPSNTVIVSINDRKINEIPNYAVLLWSKTSISCGESAIPSLSLTHPHLIITIQKDSIPNGSIGNIETSLSRKQREILDDIIIKHGNNATFIALPGTDMSALKYQYEAINNIHDYPVKEYLLAPSMHKGDRNRVSNRKQNETEYDLWQYVSHTKGADYYQKHLNELQMRGLQNALTEPLSVINGCAGSGKTKNILLPALKCAYNALEMKYNFENRNFVAVASKYSDDAAKATQYLERSWKIPKIAVFGGSDQSLNVIIDHILYTNKTKYLKGYERYSEIPIQKVGKRLVLKDCIHPRGKTSIPLFQFVNNYLHIKYGQNGEIKKGHKEILKALYHQKNDKEKKMREELFNHIMRRNKTEKHYQEMDYIINQIKLLRVEKLCMSFISHSKDYKIAQQKILDILINHCKVIFLTVDVLIKHQDIFAGENEFDYALFDDCQQLTEAQISVALQNCKQAVLFGDDKGIKPSVVYNGKYRQNVEQSLLERLCNHSNHQQIKSVFLDEQYRMHPKINSFVSEYFYDGLMYCSLGVENGKCHKSIHRDKSGYFKPFMLFDHNGVAERINKDNYVNYKESDMIDKILDKLFSKQRNIKNLKSIGIIAPYNEQRRILANRINIKHIHNISVKIGNVHEFEGTQMDIIIISCVGGDNNVLLEDKCIINMAMSRSRYCLWIFGSKKYMTNKHPIWKRLLNDSKLTNCFRAL